MEKIWRKFFQCDCGGEGIMMSYENEEDGIPSVDLAFFSHGHDNRILSFFEKLRYCWRTLTTGRPFDDEVMLTPEVAKELGTELIRFARFPYKLGDPRNNKPEVPKGRTIIEGVTKIKENSDGNKRPGKE
jgi:hypothetical protein